MSELKGRVIPFPTKKVITTFHFIDGKSIASISTDVDYIENRKEHIRNLMYSAQFTIYRDFIVNNQFITHIEFDYEDHPNKQKNNIFDSDLLKSGMKICMQILYCAFICMMIACFIVYIYFSICKK